MRCLVLADHRDVWKHMPNGNKIFWRVLSQTLCYMVLESTTTLVKSSSSYFTMSLHIAVESHNATCNGFVCCIKFLWVNGFIFLGFFNMYSELRRSWNWNPVAQTWTELYTGEKKIQIKANLTKIKTMSLKTHSMPLNGLLPQSYYTL